MTLEQLKHRAESAERQRDLISRSLQPLGSTVQQRNFPTEWAQKCRAEYQEAVESLGHA